MYNFFLRSASIRRKYLCVLSSVFVFFFFEINSMNAETKEKLFIAFTGEDLGRLEPCGCTSGQLGGLSRRHTWLDHFKAENPGAFVLLSNGDIIKDVARQDEIKLMTLVQAMNEMNYQAMNLGEKELHFGLDYLNGLSQSARFSFLSANIQSVGGQTLFPGMFRQKVNFSGRSYAVQIIGLLEPELADQGEDIHVNGIEESLRAILSAVDTQSVLRVVLYHGKEETALKWAEIFPEISLWITGHEKEESFHVTGKNAVAAIAKEGKYIGIASFDFDGDKKKCSLSEIRFYDLNDSIADSNKMKSLLNDYETELKNEKLAEEEASRWETEGLQFTGSQACMSCHASAYGAWTQSRHPHAFEDIQKKNKSFDPDCLVCHATGFKYKGGYKSLEFTPRLAEVGCEACHGMGSLHIKDPTLHRMKNPGQETCVTCHDFENSPHFEFNSYWEKIKHS
jgi:nitrate/TMAO reductase-like tetraheme cytochrome c subunit